MTCPELFCFGARELTSRNVLVALPRYATVYHMKVGKLSVTCMCSSDLHSDTVNPVLSANHDIT